MEVGITQTAYIVECGGAFADDEHCGTFLEVHRRSGGANASAATAVDPAEVLGETRLRGMYTSGYRMSLVSTTYKASPTQGDPDALYGLGNCYFTGAGVARDAPRAVSLWKRALAHPRCSPAAAGEAAHNLGMAYMNGGDGVPRNAELAARYWRQAAALGDETSMRELRDLGLV